MFVEIGAAKLYLGDCADILPTIADVNAVITDPPYGISYVSSWRKHNRLEMLANDDAPPLHIVKPIFDALADGGALYLATRFDVTPQWLGAISGAGGAIKTPIFWDKGIHTSGDLFGDFGAQVEIFIFAHKGRHLLRGRRHSNLWRFPRDPASDHPTPKPVGLITKMVAASTDAGHVVCDPFMGSGSTGVAAVQMGRRFIGVEIDEKYFDMSCRRIEQAQKQTDLFGFGSDLCAKL